MKKILITGANSYIGTSFDKYINEYFFDEYIVDTIDMMDESWKETSFEGYDCVFHVAGIAHQKETKSNRSLYYIVNHNMAVEVAKKAKSDGVKQFVFLSSMSIYGTNSGIITKETVPNPTTNYGKSKLYAEKEIATMKSDNFKICILRPPMVYGKGCKGNFQMLVKLAKVSPIFPIIHNKRSMIYISNLCECVRFCIENEINSIVFPQNKEYVSTIEIIKILSSEVGKKIVWLPLIGSIVKLLIPFSLKLEKAFGNLVYMDTEDYEYQYCIVDFDKSVRESLE